MKSDYKMKKLKPAERAAAIEWLAFISLLLFALLLHSNFKSKTAEYRKVNPKIENVQPHILEATSLARAIKKH